MGLYKWWSNSWDIDGVWFLCFFEHCFMGSPRSKTNNSCSTHSIFKILSAFFLKLYLLKRVSNLEACIERLRKWHYVWFEPLFDVM